MCEGFQQTYVCSAPHFVSLWLYAYQPATSKLKMSRMRIHCVTTLQTIVESVMEHHLPKKIKTHKPFTLKFREEPMLNQNIIDPPQWTISPHCFCCHTSSGPARSSSNYTRMVKRKSWVHLPDSLRPVLSTNSKPQDSHQKKLEHQIFNKTLGWFPTPPRNVANANPFKLWFLFARIQGWGHP